jgi:hypothetical protein
LRDVDPDLAAAVLDYQSSAIAFRQALSSGDQSRISHDGQLLAQAAQSFGDRFAPIMGLLAPTEEAQWTPEAYATAASIVNLELSALFTQMAMDAYMADPVNTPIEEVMPFAEASISAAEQMVIVLEEVPVPAAPQAPIPLLVDAPGEIVARAGQPVMVEVKVMNAGQQSLTGAELRGVIQGETVISIAVPDTVPESTTALPFELIMPDQGSSMLVLEVDGGQRADSVMVLLTSTIVSSKTEEQPPTTTDGQAQSMKSNSNAGSEASAVVDSEDQRASDQQASGQNKLLLGIAIGMMVLGVGLMAYLVMSRKRGRAQAVNVQSGAQDQPLEVPAESATFTCPHCGRPHAKSAKFCPYTGRELSGNGGRAGNQ